MLCLGIEGTAHTFGAGVVRHDGGDVQVLSNVTDMYVPEEGGIHPREAANHHADVAGAVLRRSLEEAGVAPGEVDLVAFSRGPGLGPCLRTAATAARALALSLEAPLVGVNHCVAHLEIGRAVTPAEDPVLMYASGGNTQVIAFTEGRYRVFGETLDVGIGNMLDKFARGVGIPFPGGPRIEKLALEGDTLLDLPYTIKGMDVAFSGLLTAAAAHVEKGERLEDVCFSLQETAYAMLTEVTERAVAHTEKDEVVLGGGVACNKRLREMAEVMAEARGAGAWTPEPALCVDNGAMIAHTGLVMAAAGVTTPVPDSAVDQRWRTDDVDVRWRPQATLHYAPETGADGVARGAEAVVEPAEHLGRPAVAKRRVPKAYRHPELDAALRAQRTRLEAKLLQEARAAGVRTPIVYAVDPDAGLLVMERVAGPQVKRALADGGGKASRVLHAMGEAAARLHRAGLVHGDLTTSNAIMEARDGATGDLVVIDFGLGDRSEEAEDAGTDLHVLMEALEATHADLADAWAWVAAGYRAAGGRRDVERKLDEIVQRGRYKSVLT